MSFHICVELPHDPIPRPEDPRETVAWLAEWSRYMLFEAPLGDDAVIYQYWSVPARRLGLALLGGMYQHGLRVAGAAALAQLAHEAETLEAHWHDHTLEPPAPMIQPGAFDDLLEYLHDRMGCLHEAIAIAGQYGAILTVG